MVFYSAMGNCGVFYIFFLTGHFRVGGGLGNSGLELGADTGAFRAISRGRLRAARVFRGGTLAVYSPGRPRPAAENVTVEKKKRRKNAEKKRNTILRVDRRMWWRRRRDVVNGPKRRWRSRADRYNNNPPPSTTHRRSKPPRPRSPYIIVHNARISRILLLMWNI